MNADSTGIPLTADRWRRVEEIFHAAIGKPAGERTDFVRASCKEDEALFDEVQRILAGFDAGCNAEDEARPHAAENARAGSRMGEYRIVRELAHGGMGTVYLAQRADGQYEQQVALKVVSAHLRSQFFTARFRTERQILAQLTHANITRLLDGGVSDDGEPFLVMEYVDGQRIDQYCDSRLLPIEDRLRLFLQVCAAVEYAHRNLVVHRDLKPGNIFVTADGAPKLLDFGTAKLLASEGEDSSTTRVGMITPRYASPEQLRGEPVTTLTDVFSLGVMLYELLTGAWPFGDPNSPVTGLERAVREVESSRPGAVVTEESARLRSESRTRLARLLEGDLRSVVQKAIAADPRRRYHSVEHFAEDLVRYLAGQPVLARPQTLVYRASRFARRNRWRLAIGSVIAAGLAVTAFSALRQYGANQQRMVQVREFSQSYLSDILDEVGKLPGSMKARLLMVDRARRNLDELSASAPRDGGLRRALAEAYLKLAEIQGKPFSVSLGDTEGALASYRKAERLAAQAGSSDWVSLAILARARWTIAQIEARIGKYPEALAAVQSALEPARRLARSAPAGLQVDGRPAAALEVEANWILGYVMMKRNAAAESPREEDFRRAETQLKLASSMAEGLLAHHPGMEGLAGKCSMYHGFTLEGMFTATGDTAYLRQAAEAHRHGMEMECRQAASTPNPQTERDCADAYGEWSWALHNAGDGAAAVAAGREFLARMEPIAAAEPNSAAAQQDLANAYYHLGAAENSAGKFSDALEHLRTAEVRLGPLEQLAQDDLLEQVKTFVEIRLQMGDAQLGLHRPGEAVSILEDAVTRTHGGRSAPVREYQDLEAKLAEARRGK